MCTGWLRPSRTPGEPLPAAPAQHVGVLCPVSRQGTTAGSADRAKRLEGWARNGAMLGKGPACQAGHPAYGPSLVFSSAAVGQPSGVGSRPGSQLPQASAFDHVLRGWLCPFSFVSCLETPEASSPLTPYSAHLRFPRRGGEVPCGMWAVSAGTSVHPGTGHSVGGGPGPGVGLGGGLGCLGNVAPCPSVSVGEAWVLRAGLSLLPFLPAKLVSLILHQRH